MYSAQLHLLRLNSMVKLCKTKFWTKLFNLFSEMLCPGMSKGTIHKPCLWFILLQKWKKRFCKIRDETKHESKIVITR